MLVAPPRRPRLVRAGRSPATPRSTRRYHDGSTRTRSGTLSTRRYHHGSTKINTTLSPRGYNFGGGRLGCHVFTCSRVRPGANQRFWLPPVTFPKPTPVLSGDACLFNNEVAGETPVDERGGESIASLDHFSQHVLTCGHLPCQKLFWWHHPHLIECVRPPSSSSRNSTILECRLTLPRGRAVSASGLRPYCTKPA